MLCRSEDRAAESVDWIKDDSKDSEGIGSIRYEKCNLGSMESVKKCAETLNESLDKVSMKINFVQKFHKFCQPSCSLRLTSW